MTGFRFSPWHEESLMAHNRWMTVGPTCAHSRWMAVDST